LQSRPTVLKLTLLPSAAVTLPVPEEMAHSPPDPLDSMRISPTVRFTTYVLPPTRSPVALPLKLQIVVEDGVVVQPFGAPVPVPMTLPIQHESRGRGRRRDRQGKSSPEHKDDSEQ